MKDVAQLAGVSQTTVSFVINDVQDSNIPAETRDRVLDAVRELGYRPNAAARNLRSQHTHTIGLISDDIATTPFAGQMIQGAQDEAWAHNKLILLINTGGNKHMKSEAAEALLERQVDGILYATMYHREVHPPQAIYEVPTVLVDCYVSDRSLPSVVPEETNSASVAVGILIQRGHRRIGMLNNVDPIPATIGRFQGFRNALAAAGMEFDPSLVVTGLSDQSGGHAAAMQVLVRPDRPSAIFCFNDRMAMGAYQAAAELGLSIPGDLAIIGFDNQETIAPWLRPALTTMQLPHYAMGRWAAQHLLKLIGSPRRSALEAVQQQLTCPLIERFSV
jgi:LacI family transcriptional regulator